MLIGLVRGYQSVFSPWLAPRCRFAPSCSAYAIEAVRTRGALAGTALAAWRVLRCNPWARGGVDYVPAVGQRWPRWDGVIDPPGADGGGSEPTLDLHDPVAEQPRPGASTSPDSGEAAWTPYPRCGSDDTPTRNARRQHRP